MDKYLKDNGKTTKTIYDHMMENFVNKDNFIYKCNKSIIKDYPFPGNFLKFNKIFNFFFNLIKIKKTRLKVIL